MIRHTALFKWAADATDEQKQAAATEVAKLPSIVSSIRAFASGPDAGINPGNFNFGVTADFDDEAGYLAYRDDPAHREIVQRYITPIAAQRAAVQYEF
jgi:stress responsive alpha/beta barrel protein